MPTNYEVEQLRTRLERIEQELAVARRQLDALSAPALTSHPAPAAVEAPTAVAAAALVEAIKPRAAPQPPPLPVSRIDAPEQPPLFAPENGAAPPVFRPPVASAPGVWRERLERLQLWPPSGEGNREVTLGAWWATRIGALLAVIGVVFFGVYISVGTPPWIKFSELLAASLGLALLGGWLERKLPTFGSVVLGSGLALIFFSAFAAYAVPAVKVLESPAAGAGWQLFAAGAVLTLGWRRSTPVVATMAIVFGFAAAFFSFSAGLTLSALLAALLLAATAVGVAWARNWEAPSVFALPLGYLMYACVALGVWTHPATSASRAEAWAWLAGFFGLFFVRDFVQAARGEAWTSWVSRTFFPGVNSSVAALVGVAATLALYPESLDVFYFGAGAVLVGAGLAWRLREAPGALVALLWCKASGLVALGVIATCDARTRWLVLLVQAAVLLVSAQKTGVRALRVMAAGAWLVAVFFLLEEVRAPGYAWNSLTGIAALGFVAGSVMLAGGWERARAVAGTPGLAPGLAGVVVGLVSLCVVRPWHVTGWMPTLATGLALVTAASGARLRLRSFLAAAATLYLGASVGMLTYPVALFSPAWLWLNELVVGGAAVAGVFVLAGRTSVAAAPRPRETAREQSALALAAVALSVLVGVLFSGLASWVALAVSLALGVGVLGVAPVLPRLALHPLSLLPAALGCVLTVGSSGQGERNDDAWLLLAAMVAWLAPVGLAALPVWVRTAERAKGARFTQGAHVAIAAFLTLPALAVNFDVTLLPTAYAVAAALVYGFERVLRMRGAPTAVTLFLAAGVVVALPAVGVWGDGSTVEDFARVVPLLAVLLAVPVLRRRAAGGWRALAWWQGAAALGLVFSLFLHQRGGVQPYATVGWGGAAIAVFLLGLFARERAYRLLGLLGLAFCIPRVFVVDIDSTLYRIAAFVALGGVLLWVGFSYHRFRHLVADAASPDRDLPR